MEWKIVYLLLISIKYCFRFATSRSIIVRSKKKGAWEIGERATYVTCKRTNFTSTKMLRWHHFKLVIIVRPKSNFVKSIIYKILARIDLKI